MKSRTTPENLTAQYVENTLKQNYIKNMIQGFEIASNMYLSYIEDGHSLEELKSFIKKNIEERDIIEEITNRPTNKNLINIENQLKEKINGKE